MTTWHYRESLVEIFCFAKTIAKHRSVELHRSIILDISAVTRMDELLGLYNAV